MSARDIALRVRWPTTVGPMSMCWWPMGCSRPTRVGAMSCAGWSDGPFWPPGAWAWTGSDHAHPGRGEHDRRCWGRPGRRWSRATTSSLNVVAREEAGFDRTLRAGMGRLEEAFATGEKVLGGRRGLHPARHPRLPGRADRGAGPGRRGGKLGPGRFRRRHGRAARAGPVPPPGRPRWGTSRAYRATAWRAEGRRRNSSGRDGRAHYEVLPLGSSGCWAAPSELRRTGRRGLLGPDARSTPRAVGEQVGDTGTILTESGAGRGARYGVRLPRVDRPSGPPERRARAGSGCSGHH